MVRFWVIRAVGRYNPSNQLPNRVHPEFAVRVNVTLLCRSERGIWKYANLNQVGVIEHVVESLIGVEGGEHLRLVHCCAHRDHCLPSPPKLRSILIHLVPNRLPVQIHHCNVHLFKLFIPRVQSVAVLHRVVDGFPGVVVDRLSSRGNSVLDRLDEVSSNSVIKGTDRRHFDLIRGAVETSHVE